MNTLAEAPVVQRPRPHPPASRPPLPREHGAWGILLVPFATAVGIAGIWNLPLTLLLGSVLLFFVARMSFLKQQWRWVALLLAGSAAGAAPLLLVWHRWWLVAFGVVAAPLAFRKTERHLAVQLLAMTGLTLTAPAAWYVATGQLDAMAWKLWLLNSLYFASSFFYVKMHLAAAIRRTTTGVTRGTIGYHVFLVVALVALAASGQMAWATTLAFGPAVGRALVGAARLTPKLRIKSLAWTEVGYSILFGALLVGAIRLT